MGTTHRMGWNGIINAVELLKTRGPDRTEIRIFEYKNKSKKKL